MTLSDWSGCELPSLPPTRGRYVSVEPLNFEEDGAGLFGALGGEHNDELWRFIPFEPFPSAEKFMAVMAGVARGLGWLTHVFRHPADGTVLGMASYMTLRPNVGSAEVGCVVFSKKLQRTPAATEAMFIMARHLFDDLGYRRYEWSCDDRNLPSKRAAERFGFTFEGVRRQEYVVKGLSRDSAGYSMLDSEWPRAKTAFEEWLSPTNFDAAGKQHDSLAALRRT